MFHELERRAKVKPLPGRGWYGIRRRAADVYEDYETDERVLNDQTGHKHSDMRHDIYQEREREAILAKSAETRRHVRTLAFGRALEALGATDDRSAEPSSASPANEAPHPPISENAATHTHVIPQPRPFRGMSGAERYI